MRILHLDPDAAVRSDLAAELEAAGHRVESSDTIADAIVHDSAERCDLVVTETRLADGGVLDLLRRLHLSRGGSLPPIAVLADQPEPGLAELCARAGVRRFLRKSDDWPINASELHGLLSELDPPRRPAAPASGVAPPAAPARVFRGSLDSVDLVEVVQLLNLGRKTGTLLLFGGSREGRLHLRGGEVVAAACGASSGSEAFRALLRVRGGSFRFEVGGAPAARTIHEPTGSLLLDALRREDEEGRASGTGGSPTERFGDAVDEGFPDRGADGLPDAAAAGFTAAATGGFQDEAAGGFADAAAAGFADGFGGAFGGAVGAGPASGLPVGAGGVGDGFGAGSGNGFMEKGLRDGDGGGFVDGLGGAAGGALPQAGSPVDRDVHWPDGASDAGGKPARAEPAPARTAPALLPQQRPTGAMRPGSIPESSPVAPPAEFLPMDAGVRRRAPVRPPHLLPDPPARRWRPAVSARAWLVAGGAAAALAAGYAVHSAGAGLEADAQELEREDMRALLLQAAADQARIDSLEAVVTKLLEASRAGSDAAR